VRIFKRQVWGKGSKSQLNGIMEMNYT